MSSRLQATLARNTIANYTGSLLTLAIGFVITPFLVRSLGDSQYAIWVLLGSVIAYFNLFDFGLASSLSKYVAEYNAQERERDLNVLAGTVFAVYLGLAAILGVVLYFCAPWFVAIFNVPAGMETLATQAFLLIALNFVILLPTSILNALLVGYQRIDLNNVANVVTQVLNALLLVYYLRRGNGLLAVAIISIATTLVLAALRLYFLHRSAPQLTLNPLHFRPDVARGVLGYSSAVFVIQISGLVLFRIDSIILGLLYPVAVITPYSVTYKLASMLQALAAPLSMVLFPAYAHLKGQFDDVRLRQLFIQGSRAMVLITLVMAAYLSVFGGDVLALWMGEAYRAQQSVLFPLVWFFVVIAVSRVAGALLIGIGQARARMFFALGDIVLNFSLCYLFARRWGPVGLAWADVISVSIVMVVGLIPFVCRVMNVTFVTYLRRVFMPVIFPFAATVILLLAMKDYTPITGWLTALAYTMVAVVVYFAFYLVVGADTSERNLMVARLRALRHTRQLPSGR